MNLKKATINELQQQRAKLRMLVDHNSHDPRIVKFLNKKLLAIRKELLSRPIKKT